MSDWFDEEMREPLFPGTGQGPRPLVPLPPTAGLGPGARLIVAAVALADKLDEISLNAEFQSVFQLAWTHGQNYGGPTWGEELENLKMILGGLTPDLRGPDPREVCDEVSSDGALCVLPFGHEGPHACARPAPTIPAGRKP